MNQFFSLFRQTGRIGSVMLAVCISMYGLQAQTVTVTGTVTDGETKQVLVGASVSIPADGAGAFTNEKGAFSIALEAKGRNEVQINISYAGYSKIEQMVPLQQGPVFEIKAELLPEGYTTEDVVITASRSFEQKQADVTVSIEVVKPAAIDLQATADITKVLTQIPGVDVLDGQVNIRGSSGFAYGVGSRVMVMLDGLPLLSGDAATAELKLLPVDNVSQIEVVKGASSVLYGSSALGGVINVLTSDPGEKPRTSLRIRTGMYDRPNNRALDWDGSSSAYSASAHLFHSRRIGDLSLTLQTDIIKNSGYRQGTDQELYRFFAMTKYQPKGIPGLDFGLNFSTRIDSSGSILYWRSYNPDTTVAIFGNDTTNLISGGALTPTRDGGGYRKQINRRLALDPYIKYLSPKGNLFWYRGRMLSSNNDNNTDQTSKYQLYYNDFLYQTTIFDKINWVSGVTYTYSRVDGADLYASETIVGEDTTSTDGIFSGSSVGVYSQLDGKFGKLNTSLGVRLESVKIDTLERETQPVIRLGLNYEIIEGTNIRASFGQAFRVPSVAERYVSTTGGGIITIPNPNIKSETGYSAEIGLRQGFRFNSSQSRYKGYIDVAAFSMRYDDMVEFGLQGLQLVPETAGKFSSVNIADARINGIELSMGAFANWRDWDASFSGGVTYIDPQNLNAVPEENQLDLSGWPNNIVSLLNAIANDDIVDQPSVLKYRTKWTVRGSGSVGYKDLSLTTNFRYRSYMESIDQFLYLIVTDLGPFRQKHPDGDTVVDFILNYDVSDKSSISLNVDNAFNEEYLIIPGFLAEQREYTVQYQFRF